MMPFDYDAIVRGYAAGVEPYGRTWRQPHPWLDEERAELARRVPGGALLDVGCGPGHEAHYWSEHGFDVVGVDISPEMVALARRNYADVRFVVCDLFDVATLGTKFAAVWCAYVLLHVGQDDLGRALDALRSVLAPGGLLFIATPVGPQDREEISDVAGLSDRNGNQIALPRSIWRRETLMSALRAGFDVVWSRLAAPLPGRAGVISLLAARRRSTWSFAPRAGRGR